jgi:hypothetical protein
LNRIREKGWPDIPAASKPRDSNLTWN